MTWLYLKMIFLIDFIVLITDKRRVKILKILWDFRGDSVISEDVGNIKQVQTLINELILINSVLEEAVVCEE